MPKKNREEDIEDPEEHVFTEYACDCGASWPKDQGKVCLECGTAKP